jgi:hypothetical protein
MGLKLDIPERHKVFIRKAAAHVRSPLNLLPVGFIGGQVLRPIFFAAPDKAYGA